MYSLVKDQNTLNLKINMDESDVTTFFHKNMCIIKYLFIELKYLHEIIEGMYLFKLDENIANIVFCFF